MQAAKAGLWLARARGVFVGVGAVAYSLISYRANAYGRHDDLSVACAFVPVLLLFFGLAWSASLRRLYLTIYALLCLVLWHYRALFVTHASWAFLVEDVGVLGLLSAVFARTLRPMRTPLISRLSVLVHGGLSPQLARYTRGVTLLWASVFALMAAISVGLFLFASRPVWALYANVLTWPIMIFVFMGEYLVRRRLVAPEERSGFLEVIIASRAHWQTILAPETKPFIPPPRADHGR